MSINNIHKGGGTDLLLLRRRMMGRNTGQYIVFEDPEVEAICVAAWSSDGVGLTPEDAAAVTTLGGNFYGVTSITKFNEFKYFTSIQSLNYQAFAGCANLEEITMPDTTSIKITDQRAFSNCGSLRINIPSMDWWFYLAKRSSSCPNFVGTTPTFYVTGVAPDSYTIPAGETEIKGGSQGGTFTGWSQLHTIHFNGNETTIGDRAFWKSGVRNLLMPETITSIGVRAFYGAGAYSDPQSVIYLPNLTTLGTEAFSAFHGPLCVDSLGSISALPGLAFFGANIVRLTLPDTMTDVSADRCIANLQNSSPCVITCLAALPPVATTSSLPAKFKVSSIRVPAEAVDAYKTAPGWSTFADIIQAINK